MSEVHRRTLWVHQRDGARPCQLGPATPRRSPPSWSRPDSQTASQSRRCPEIASGLARTPHGRRQAWMRRKGCPDTERVTVSWWCISGSVARERGRVLKSTGHLLDEAVAVMRERLDRMTARLRPALTGLNRDQRDGQSKRHRRFLRQHSRICWRCLEGPPGYVRSPARPDVSGSGTPWWHWLHCVEPERHRRWREKRLAAPLCPQHR